MKRILLFVVTNLAVMLVLGIAASVLGVNRFLTANGLNLGMLLAFAALMGFGGAIISLLMSKPVAKWSTGAQIINNSNDPTHRWIVSTVERFAQKAGIGMPEVAIYEGEPNAFATGAFKNSALVAVSTGLLQTMNRQEVEAVIGHEVAHVANGDMVTMTLIQGVMNTFVVFLSRVIGYVVDRVILKNDREGPGIGYYVTTIVLDIVLGVNRFLTANGLNLGMLLAFAALMGFGGAIISLLMSKPMAKWSTGAQVINGSTDPTHRWIVGTVQGFAQKAGIGMPEVAVFEGEPNAFATGAFKNSALVAVSTGLLQTMNREEVEAVIGHEVAHVANGDMVTMTLIQGVMNTFVVFLSRVIGYFVDKVILKNDRDGVGIGYYVTTIVLDLVLGLLAAIIVAWFSRQREYRADAGAAQLMGRKQPMINALARLGGMQPGELPQSVQTMGISGKPSGMMALFSSHPPIEDRIRALQQAQ